MEENKLAKQQRQLINLNSSDLTEFKILIADKIRLICELHSKNVSDEVIVILTDQICTEFKRIGTKEVLESLLGYLEVPPPDYFTPISIITYLREKIQQRALKQLDEIRKKQQEKYYEDLTKPKNDIELEKIDQAASEAIQKMRENLKPIKTNPIKVGDIIRQKLKNHGK